LPVVLFGFETWAVVVVYLYDKSTNAHLQICLITYYYFSPTCCSHLCDHHQGVL